MIKGMEKAHNTAITNFLLLLFAQVGLGSGTEIDWADQAPQLTNDLTNLIAPAVVSAVGAGVGWIVTYMTGNTAETPTKPPEPPADE